MVDLVGEEIAQVPSYGLMRATIGGCEVVISQTGFSGEKGYEIYLQDATLHAETLWHAILEAGEKHRLRVVAPAHHRRIAAGILSWGQDMDAETLPFQVNLGYQVPRNKLSDYVGRSALEAARAAMEDADLDYFCTGPLWETPTKPGRAAVGTALLTATAAEADKPWFAIGGIAAGERLDAVRQAGANRAVVVRAITSAEDPAAAARELKEELE